MKKAVLFSILILLFFTGCEDVVQVDLDKSNPRLVIEASMTWKKGFSGQDQVIKLSLTTPFFQEEFSPATNASVEVTTEAGYEFIFQEIDPGIYINRQFQPKLDSTFYLKIEYENETYTASEKFIPVPTLQEVVQSNNGGINGKDVELKAFFNDPSEEKNYYLIKYYYSNLAIQLLDDEYINGNRTFTYFTSQDLKAGEEVGIELQGVSKEYYDYLFILSAQAGTNAGGPFQTQPTTVRGNIVNQTNPENFAFGYFRLSQTDYINYTIE